jgi:predicted MPP superfamily phosphohydrolase
MNRRTFLKALLGTAGATLIGSGTYAYESNRVEISRERLVVRDLYQKLRVVAISDIHAPSFARWNPDLVTLINNECPDILILAGDTIDREGNENLVEVFGAVKARVAKLATLGNWEYKGRLDLDRLRGEYESAGISLLINAALEVSGLKIVGLDDFLYGSPDYRILKSLMPCSGSVLVISHCPKSFDLLAPLAESPLIVLSGHTHGGQIAPFGVVPYTPPGSGRFVKGWYHDVKDNSMYVMRGVGATGIPLRVGARPELLVLDIHPSI